MSGIKIVRFKYRIENDGGITRRLFHWWDLPVLNHLFSPEVFHTASGVESRASSSLFSFRRWIVNIFQVVYVIEAGENSGRRIIGFIGLYNMKIGRSLWLSMAIFDSKDRGRGYGRHVLELLLNSLQKDGIVKTVYAEVLNGNVRSMHVLEDLGFDVCGRHGGRLLLERSLVSRPSRT